MEEVILKNQKKKRMEIAEAEQNRRKENSRRQCKGLEEIKPSSPIPEGWKRTRTDSVDDGGMEGKQMMIERLWMSLAQSLNTIETREDWVDAEWLEKSSLEEQKDKVFGNRDKRDAGQACEDSDHQHHDATRDKNCTPKNEDANNIPEEEIIAEGRTPTNKVEEVTVGTTDFTYRRQLSLQYVTTDVEPTDVTYRRQLNAKNITTEDSSMLRMMTTESIPTDAAYKTSDEPTEVTPKKMKMQEEEEEINKAGKDDATSAKLGKNMSEIRMGPTETSDAVRRLARDSRPSLERSPVNRGRVMKKSKGTPHKINVKKIRELFEQKPASSPTKGYIELLQQPSKRDFNLLNLQTTTRCGQNSSRYCADQPQPGFQTRPRQAAGVGTEMCCDRPGQARLVQTDQPGDL